MAKLKYLAHEATHDTQGRPLLPAILLGFGIGAIIAVAGAWLLGAWLALKGDL